jgi:hypothetical protein
VLVAHNNTTAFEVSDIVHDPPWFFQTCYSVVMEFSRWETLKLSFDIKRHVRDHLHSVIKRCPAAGSQTRSTRQ